MKQARKGAMLLVTALVLSVGLAGSVWAQPMKTGRGAAIQTPEQAAKLFDLEEKLHADTVDLRRQMKIKMAELYALGTSEKPDTKAIQAKKKELQDLSGKYQEKKTAYQQEVKKIVPESGMGRGMGPGHAMPPGHEHMGGPGMGAGPGQGMGAGPGASPPPAPQPGATPPAPAAAPPAK